MSPQSLRRIEQSFDQLEPNVDEMTRRFYDHLFTAMPEVRPLFQVNMDVQRRHFAAALALIARNLRMLDIVTEPLRQLGADHARIGVRPEQYPSVRDAMLMAMAETLGPAWTDNLATDWRELLDLICSAMLEGASQHAAAAVQQ